MANYNFDTDLTVKPQQYGSNLGDIVNMARGVQAYQKQAATMPAEIEQAKAQSAKSQLDLLQNQVQMAGGAITGLENSEAYKANDIKGLKKELSATKQWTSTFGHSPAIDTLYQQAEEHLNMGDVQGYKSLLQRVRNSLATNSEKYAASLPGFQANAAGNIISTNRAANTLGEPGIAGAQPTTPAANAQLQNQFTQRTNINPSTAQAGMINAAATNYATDFTKSQETASNSEPRIALFQNIKKLAPESFTGVGGARKELAAGIAQAVGLDVYQTEKMSTDELAKSSAMLSLAGGNTDMARQMAEAANPNKKMNEQAIKQIADQMIGMERLNQAKVKFLQPVANDPNAYAQRLAEFNKINDFRIFQESSPEEVKKLKASMSPEEQKRMGDKIRMARQLGLL